jgi:hypothetical protein
VQHAQVNDFAVTVNTLAVQNLEFSLTERGATLFFTTLTRVSLPTTSSPSFTAPVRRMSRRTEA